MKLLGIAIVLVIVAASLIALRRLNPKRVHRLGPCAVRTLRRVLRLAILGGGAFTLLELCDVVQAPPWLLVILPLALPMVFSGLISGALTSVVPGVLALWFDRYPLDAAIIIGNPYSPLAKGTVDEVNLLAVYVSGDQGRQSVSHARAQGEPVTVLS